jgi:DNA invertase Pin-like site-specific DNA recombinase
MDGRFVAYYRVSTDKQKRSGLGLEAQRETVRGFLNGGQWELVGEFTETESGRSADRPELAKALARCRVMKATLIVANVSRLTRSVAFLSRLLEAGVDVRFCDLPQIEGPTGRFMLQQMAAVAELEAGLIGDRTKKALAAAKANGVKLGNPRNLTNAETGRMNGRAARTKIATGRAADLAPIIADLQASGATSLRQIATGLNARGIRTARGGTWSAVQVQRVLERA